MKIDSQLVFYYLWKTRVVVVMKIASDSRKSFTFFISLNFMVNQDRWNSQSVGTNIFCKIIKIVWKKLWEIKYRIYRISEYLNWRVINYQRKINLNFPSLSFSIPIRIWQNTSDKICRKFVSVIFKLNARRRTFTNETWI